jgi:hypothetical protein
MKAMKDVIQVTLSKDKTEAYITLAELAQEVTYTKEELVTFLADHDVKYGIIPDAITKLVAVKPIGQRITVAKGEPSLDGRDGWVEYLFKGTSKKPKTHEDGSIDFHDLDNIDNVAKGQKLAIVHPPVPGKPGKKVNGEPAEAHAIDIKDVPRGENTGIDPADHSAIIATADGNCIVKRDGSLEVQPIIKIRGDVDFSTGNIDFVGSVIVYGDVKNDFTIKVKKNLEVFGNVEDVHIEAEGDVALHRGFIGSGKGKIIAKGNVIVHHVLNQTIISEKDITINIEAVNSTIEAGGKILAKTAIVLGGTITAYNSIEVKTLGNPEHSRVTVQVGRRKTLLTRITKMEADLKLGEKQLVEVNQLWQPLMLAKVKGVQLEPEKLAVMQKLEAARNSIRVQSEQWKKQIEIDRVELEKEREDYLLVGGTVFENVIIDINGAKKLIIADVIAVEFRKHLGEVTTSGV